MSHSIEAVLREAGLSDCRYEPKGDGGDTYVVHVPRARVAEAEDRLLDVGRPGLYVHVRQVTPTLVAADVGQAVRVYNPRTASDAESPVGLVTSVRTVDGRTVYGCGYILLMTRRQPLGCLYSFELSNEDYGGFHLGFLAVLSPDELAAALTADIEDAYREAVEAAQDARDRATQSLPALVAAVGTGAVSTVKRWDLPEEAVPRMSNFDKAKVVFDHRLLRPAAEAP